ncbi:hypothetical protein JL722_9216 [Aureococcus anophagefferens]|nr:hypothetical protein JL722_9216 [Aureococcus anophagefferens]
MPQAHNAAALKNTTNTAPAADDDAPAPTTAAAKLAAAARGRTERRRAGRAAAIDGGRQGAVRLPQVVDRGRAAGRVVRDGDDDGGVAEPEQRAAVGVRAREVAVAAAASGAAPTLTRVAVGHHALRARALAAAAAAAPGEAAAPIAEVESEAALRAAEQMSTMLESVGKAPIVPGLLVTTFAGSTDEDIAEACEKMRAPKGQRWDVTAKIKARDEKLGALRSLLSRVAEQRKAFGTLVSQIEVKLLATAAEERDKADKADKALAREAAKLLEVKLAAAATARDAAEAAAAEGKAEAAELKESLGAASAELVSLKEASMRDAGLVEGTLLAGQDRTAAQASRVAAAERERDELRAALAEARAGLSVATEGSSATTAATERLLADATAERDAARAEAAAARRSLADQTAAIARAEGKAEMASAHATEALLLDKVSAAVAACDANVASARRAARAHLEASVASHADALQALRSELAASEAERDRLGEASARADGGAAETRGARDAEAARDLRASSTRDGRGRSARERTAALAQLLALQGRCDLDRAAFEAEAAALGDDRAANDAALAARAADRRALDAATEGLAARETELASLRAELDEKNEIDAKAQALALSEARGEVEALRRRLAATEEATRDAAATCEGRVAEMEEKLRDADVTRRKLHNTIQELRGNIRVFARVRPFLPSDGAAADAPPVVVDMADGTSLTLAAEDDDADGEPFGDKKRKRRKELFSYDHVFGPSTGQERVFTEVAEFVQSALDGYQVCLFSYGQTGSGKTHTMQGTGTGPMRGIIPRAMEQVAAYCDAQRARGWAYEMEVSYVEIYNEQPAGLEVRRDPKTGRVYVDGCTRTPVDPGDKAMVDDLMQCAATHRCVAATDMNAVSSRSHAVFTLHLTGTHAEKKARLKGALNLVDLAGSERLDRSGAVGQRAKEAAHINKSLSALAGVFSALNRKQTHVPYRDSKLTFLLQPALSGDGKTLLFVNLSPTPGSANESLCSLRFAKQVQSVELGKAKRHIETVH